MDDDVFRKQFYRRFLSIPDWRLVWDKLNAGAFDALSNECRGEMSLDQLAYCANRHAASIRGSYVPRQIKPRPLKSTSVYVWVIYWLFNEDSPEFPLYVGQTRQLSERWTAHKNGSSGTSCIKDRSTLRIKVVETVCGSERMALAAEKKHIKAALLINANLLNKASL